MFHSSLIALSGEAGSVGGELVSELREVSRSGGTEGRIGPYEVTVMLDLFFCYLVRGEEINDPLIDYCLLGVGVCGRIIPCHRNLQGFHDPCMLEVLRDQLGKIGVVVLFPVEPVRFW